MRVIGIDPSSQIGGVALIDTPEHVVNVSHWKRAQRSSHPQGLLAWHKFLVAYIGVYKPQMAAIEMHAYSGGKKNEAAAHAVAYYQGVAALTSKLCGLMVVEIRVSTARSIVLGNGGLSKDAAWEVMRKRYPDLFAPKTTGGLDEMDALTAALAGESAAER